MKTLLSRLVLSPLKKKIRQPVEAFRRTPSYVDRFELGPWSKAQGLVRERSRTRPAKRLLILPSDPITFQGAKGDEAMMEASLRVIRQTNPGVEVGAITASDQASAIARASGFKPLQNWNRPFSYESIARAVSAFEPDICVVLGADVLDGYYSTPHAARMLLTADLVARTGADVEVLGFSFNSTPSPGLARLFERLHPRVHLNVRDRVSYDRFVAFTSRPAQLVADSAFMLAPTTDSTGVLRIAEWVATRRAEGRTVVGFNLHPMLFRNATREQISALIERSGRVLADAAAERRLSWLLIPHDYRGSLGDDVCLAPIGQALKPKLGDDVFHMTGEFTAAELKGAAGLLDGVITARMHLAIAALGGGVPVAAVVYQDKFRGLFGHFGLPDTLMMAPEELIGGNAFDGFVRDFIDHLPDLRAQVAAALPAVKDLSAKNFGTVA
ncbi:polysaccharide pyruvyl transferase family protein [Tistrella mobilis]|uniref:polysaccharide pyruvyl transferase family protein n=1 Tax=Tistrella mobilis TaxID=171437 RepID=UPI003556E2F0